MTDQVHMGVPSGPFGQVLRFFSLASLCLVLAYTLNNFLIHVGDFRPLMSGGLVVIAVYAVSIVVAIWLSLRLSGHSLIETADSFTAFNTYLVRGAFWAVLLVGLVDATISFLRIEEFSDALFGESLAGSLNKQNFRGPFVHMPLVALSFVIAAFTRGLGFIWLTLLVVLAELLIVLTVNIYSYEQAFQADLVRFWYAALFLFATAYTLLEGGHVRVDVLFAAMPQARKHLVNLWGALILGMPLAWITLVIGTWDQSRIINSPILNFEIGQQSVGGLYIKYLMAGFLLILGITLVIQFAALMMSSAAGRAQGAVTAANEKATFSD